MRSGLLDALQAVHRLALRAFPRGFRDRYGAEMSDAYRAYCGAAAGVAGLVVRGVHGVVEAVAEGLSERMGGGLLAGGTAIELRSAVRGLVRSPGFAGAVIVVLGLGIGATVAVYGFAQSLGGGASFDAGPSLVVVGETYTEPGGPREERAVGYPTFEDWRVGTTAFEALAARDTRQLPLLSGDDAPPSLVGGAFVSAALPAVLRTGVSGGRWFDEAEDAAAARVAVVSEDLWRTRLGGGAFVPGRTLRLGDVVVDVVGVAEPGFRGAFGGLDVWLPIHTLTVFDAGRSSLLDDRGTRGLFVLGRLRAGTTLDDARAQLDGVTASLRASGALPETRGARIERFDDRYFGDARRTAALLLGAVALLLLVACTNVANLMLARQLGRHDEIALRRALGARGAMVARPLLLEGLLLALCGGALGVLSAPWLMRVLSAATLAGLPDYVRPTVQPMTVVFAVLVSGATAVLSSVVPAVAGSRTSAARGGRGALGAGDRGRRALVVAQIAVAVPLLAAAGLTLRSIAAQRAIDPGFDAAGVVTASVSLPRTRYTAEGAAAFARRLQDALVPTPGLEVAVAGDVPIASGYSAMNVAIETGGAQREHRVYVHSVGPGYFDVLGMRLVDGRFFDDRDDASGAEAVILSETAARRFFPGEPAVGRLIEGAQVVGVVGDAAFRTLLPDPVGNPDDPDVFLPFAQSPAMEVNVLMRGAVSGASLVEQVREAVRGIDPALPVSASSTLAEVIDGQVAADRALARQLALFALFALLLAATGLYGVMAYTVSRRAPELGVRMALGAERGALVRHILGRSMVLVVTGLLLGLFLAAAAAAVLRSRLYGVSSTDPLTYLVVVGVLALAGLCASAVPAWRATRVEPAAVLRT